MDNYCWHYSSRIRLTERERGGGVQGGEKKMVKLNPLLQLVCDLLQGPGEERGGKKGQRERKATSQFSFTIATVNYRVCFLIAFKLAVWLRWCLWAEKGCSTHTKRKKQARQQGGKKAIRKNHSPAVTKCRLRPKWQLERSYKNVPCSLKQWRQRSVLTLTASLRVCVC